MKEYCPACRKEVEVKEVLEDLDKDTGILVRVLECGKCGETLADAKEYERAQQELNQRNVLKIRRSIVKVGNSLALRLPEEIAKIANLKERENVEIYVNAKNQIIVEPA